MHTGVTQMMNNQNYCSKQSSMNMIALSNVKEQSKDAKRRQVKLSQFGKECPSESPEGGKIGHNNHMTIMAQSSIKRDSGKVYDTLIAIINKMNTMARRKAHELNEEKKKQDKKAKKRKSNLSQSETNATLNSSAAATNEDTMKQTKYNTDSNKENRFFDYETSETKAINYKMLDDLMYLIFSQKELDGHLKEKPEDFYSTKRKEFINMYSSNVKIFLNMNLIAMTENPKLFVDLCKQSKTGKQRRSAALAAFRCCTTYFTNISFSFFFICCDATA
jgi:hypothetical protein